MKLHLPKPLQTALAATASAVTFATVATGSSAFAEGTTSAGMYGTDLGTVQFVGDSITHGSDLGGTHNAASWRWAIHKIFVDNGIAYSENGYHVGNYSGGGYVPVYPGGSTYGGVGWDNRHSAQASGRAYELIAPNNSRYEGNTPDTLVQNYPSDIFFLLIGTNDTLSDYANRGGVGGQGNLARFSSDLLGCTENAGSSYTFSGNSRMDTIVDTFHKNGDGLVGTEDDAPVVVLSIPTWSPNHGNNNKAEDFAAMAEYNKRMKAWSEQKEGVTYVEVNTGLVDVANTVKPGAGVNSMFNDNLHPGGQGDLIIAGNVAKALGYAGRSVGLTRQDAASWDHAEGALTLTSSSAAQTFAADAFDSTNGYTIDFNATFGDGSTGDWLDAGNALTITVGDGTRGGTLKMSEAYISWGDSILYSRDNSVATEDHLRIAFVNGSTRAEDNVTAGYYVWLGDMLIGEGLSYSESSFNGISLGVTGSGTGSVSSLSWVDTAYAPTTTGVRDASNSFVTMASHDNTDTVVSSGIDWTTGVTEIANQNGVNDARYFVDGIAKVKLTALSSWFAAGACTATGDVQALVSGATTGYNAFAWQSGTLTGDVTMQFLNSSIAKGGYKTNNVMQEASIAGSYGGASITGTFSAYVDNCTLAGDMVGGALHGAGSIGAVKFVVNSGTINGSIYGGSKTAGTVGNGEADSEGNFSNTAVTITINGGHITGSVDSGGPAGTVNGNAEIIINGGIIDHDVTDGSVIDENGNVTRRANQGKTTVTVQSNKAYIGGNITADTVKLKNVEVSGTSDGFDKYAGTITATSLELDNYTAKALGATLNVSDALTTKNGTNTAVSKNASIGTLTLQTNTQLTFHGKLSLTNGLWLNQNDTGSGTSVVLNGGYSVTTGVGQNNLFDLVLGSDTSATIDCTYTTSRLLGHASGSTLTFGEHAIATVGGIYGSTTIGSNGTLTINAGAKVTSGGIVKSNILNLNGSLTVQGDLGVNTLNMSGGTLSYTKNTNAALANVNASGGRTSTISGQINITGALTVQADTQLTLNGMLTLTNGLQLTNSGASVVLNGGYSVRTGVGQSNLFDLVLGSDTSATINCTYTTSRILGHLSDSELTFGEHAIATVGGIYGSTTIESNGTLTINAGAKVTSGGIVKSNTLNLNGSLTVQGDLGVNTLNMSGGTLTYTKNTAAALANVNVSGGQTSTISGKTNITGTLKVDSSSLTFDGGTHTIANLVGDDSADRTGVVTLRNQAAVSAVGLTFGARGEKYEVESGSSLSITGNSIKVEAATDAEKATMYATYNKVNGRYSYGLGYDGYVIENALVTLTDTATVKNKLVNAEVVANATGANKTVTFEHTGNTLKSVKAQAGNVIVKNANSSAATLKSIKAEGGNVTLQGLAVTTEFSLETLVICDNKTVNALTSGNTHADGQNNIANIDVTGKLTVGKNATLNANLTMSAGSTLSMANGNSLNMGCALTLSKGMTLATDDATATSLSTYDSVLATGYNTRWLYTSVESLTLQDVGTLSYTDGNIEGDITQFNHIDASAYFTNLTSGTYYLSVVDNGASFDVGITAPEPTTATLSMLALCALAARRRRK